MAAMQPEIPIRPFPGGFALAGLMPPPTATTQPQIDELEHGRLVFQVCASCRRWRPLIAPVCPHCGDRRWNWQAARGAGTAVSWVRYHRAYLEAFKPLVPYVVLCVELDERLRIFGRLAGEGAAPAIGLRVAAIIERWADGRLAPAFVPAAAG